MAALESQQLLAGQLTGLQAQQALMAQQLAAAHASNNALKAELAQVQVGFTGFCHLLLLGLSWAASQP